MPGVIFNNADIELKYIGTYNIRLSKQVGEILGNEW